MSDVCLRDGNQKTHAIRRCFNRFPEGKVLPGGRPPRLATGQLYRRGLQPAGATVGGVHHVAAGRLESGLRAPAVGQAAKLAAPELAKLVFICFYFAIAV